MAQDNERLTYQAQCPYCAYIQRGEFFRPTVEEFREHISLHKDKHEQLLKDILNRTAIELMTCTLTGGLIAKPKGAKA